MSYSWEQCTCEALRCGSYLKKSVFKYVYVCIYRKIEAHIQIWALAFKCFN